MFIDYLYHNPLRPAPSQLLQTLFVWDTPHTLQIRFLFYYFTNGHSLTGYDHPLSSLTFDDFSIPSPFLTI